MHPPELTDWRLIGSDKMQGSGKGRVAKQLFGAACPCKKKLAKVILWNNALCIKLVWSSTLMKT